jgi:hypothetical protein
MTEMYFKGPGFHMKVPSDWFITSNPQVQAMFVAPTQNGARANLMITLRPLDPSATLESIVATTLETQKKEYPEFVILEQGEYPKGDLIGHQHLYSWYNQQHSAHIVQRQVIFIAGQMLVSITTTRTRTGDADDFDIILTAMLQSFEFD